VNILGIDTTTNRLCLGLYAQGKFYEYSLNTGRKLSALLVPAIRQVLAGAGVKITDIDYFACGLGPGSFTGMRIGLATIKALSIVKNKPVVGISTLDILARNAQVKDRLIVPVLDARRSLVYCSAYKYEQGLLKRKSGYLLISPEELAGKFPATVVLLGEGAALHADTLLSRIKNAVILDKDHWSLQAYNLMELAQAKIKAKEFTSALTVKPIYLYPKECQIKTR
jgi:tRNA threonylcarbamoyladenosine biosynthesis protein TsaB